MQLQICVTISLVSGVVPPFAYKQRWGGVALVPLLPLFSLPLHDCAGLAQFIILTSNFAFRWIVHIASPLFPSFLLFTSYLLPPPLPGIQLVFPLVNVSDSGEN